MKKCVSRIAPKSLLTSGALACVSLLLAGCLDGGDGETAQQTTSSGPAGTIVAHPTGGLGSKSFIVDTNRGGNATNLRIQGVFWGRLVTVQDSVPSLGGGFVRSIQHVDYVVGEQFSDGFENSDYSVSTNPVTEVTTMTIKHPAGSAAYTAALLAADDNLIPIQRKGLGPNELPPFSLAPRNAAIVIQFDDLLGFYFDEGLDGVSPLDDVWRDFAAGNLINSAGQINSSSVQVRTGNPPTASFRSRVFPDPNHGDRTDRDGDGRAEFFPTRIIVDTTTSEIEAASVLPALLSPNSLGLPPSVTTQLPNIAIRIPTEAAGSVTTPLHNPSSPLHTIARDSLENIDFESATIDAVRAMRSGGSAGSTGDVNNGFLADDVGPKLVGSQQVTVSALTPDIIAGPEFFRLTMTYDLPACAATPKVGDVIRQLGVFAEITETGGTPTPAGVVANVQARVLFPLGATLVEVPSTFLTTFDPINDATIPVGCFARFSPPASLPPNEGVSPAAQMTLRFTEAMDPASLLPFDSMTLTRLEAGMEPGPFDFLVGEIVSSPDLREFTFVPTLPMQHTAGSAEDYFLRLAPGADGPTDLAGNALVDELPEVVFNLDPNAATEETGGVVLRFNEASELDNEVDPTMPTREVRGQLLFDTSRGRILSRPVTRTSVPADRSQPTPSVMTAFPGGVQTPLSPLGSKMQTLYRYIDLGMSGTDETNFNLDIEGISWSPASGAALFDFYDQFEIRLSHSRFQPDEVLDAFGFPQFPNSGLQKNYNNNRLTPNDAPQKIVHPRELGYVVSPGDQYNAESGTAMMPYPLNRTGPISDYIYYTWRDNSILGTGGPSGQGSPLAIEEQILGFDNPPDWGINQVQAVALPLLMEFRCFPRDGAQGLNGFEIALAVGSSSTPNFRAFSTGGTGTGQTTITRNPDLETTARGGFNPGSNPPGQPTRGVDNSYYIGLLDLVTRVSRAHTIWFDLGTEVPDITITSPSYMNPVIEPRPEEQPNGTSVTMDFRGASSIANLDGTRDALSLDAYGDGAGPAFLGGSTWKSSISQIDGARFFQVRFTFVSNTETGLTPAVSAFGVAFQQ